MKFAVEKAFDLMEMKQLCLYKEQQDKLRSQLSNVKKKKVKK